MIKRVFRATKRVFYVYSSVIEVEEVNSLEFRFYLLEGIEVSWGIGCAFDRLCCFGRRCHVIT